MRPGRRSSRSPVPHPPGPRLELSPASPPSSHAAQLTIFCLTCCSSLWEERGLQLACIPDHRGCRGYPGWRWSSWVNPRAQLALWSAEPAPASAGAEMRGPALEWVVLGNRLSPGRKEWQPLKAGQKTVPFSSKPAAAIQACRFGSAENCASDFVELASQRGLWERVHNGSPLH